MCLARLRFSSHFSIIWDTLPPKIVTTLGVNQSIPWQASSPSLLNSSLVPGGVLILMYVIGLVSKAVQVDFPSCIVSFSIRGACAESSLAFGADTFLIFWIWTTMGRSRVDGSLVKSSGKAPSPISLKSYWKNSNNKLQHVCMVRNIEMEQHSRLTPFSQEYLHLVFGRFRSQYPVLPG